MWKRNRTTQHFPHYCCSSHAQLKARHRDEIRNTPLNASPEARWATRTNLLLGLLVVVALPCEAYAYAVRYVTHTLVPDELVELGVDADVAGVHDLGRHLLDLADCARGLLFEGAAIPDSPRVPGGWKMESKMRANAETVISGARITKRHMSQETRSGTSVCCGIRHTRIGSSKGCEKATIGD